MRKSPGKWLKKILSGRKSFRSSSTKSKNSSEKGLTTGYERLGDNSPIISEPVLVSTYGSTTLPIVEETHHSDVHGCEAARPVVIQSTVDQVASSLDESSSCDKLSQERAATKAQAAIRGFLARRAFQALKGIVRLQALIRGHLVRRQAIATLYAMHAIVRLQALFRGRTASGCDIGHQIYSTRKQKYDLLNCTYGDTWKNNFHDHSLGGRLLSSQIVFKPLQIQYDEENPNSTSNWLERWHTSHFWKPNIKTNLLDHSKDPEKKRRNWTVRQSVRTKKLGPNSEPEKPKGNHHNQTPETPKTELEKPKRGLRKVSTTKPEADSGKLSSGSMKSQSKTVRETSKNSEAASKIMGAKPSEASLSLSADGEFTFHKRQSLPSFGEEVTEKDLHASTTMLKSVPDAATSKEKSLSGSGESTSKQNNRRKPSSSISRLEIPEKELHASVSSSASKILPDGSPSKEKPSMSSRDSGNKSNHRRRSSLSSVSKTLQDGNPSEEKSLSGGGDCGNKSSNGRRSSLSNASKNFPDGNPSEEKSLSSSGDSGHKLSHRRRSSLTIARLEISETKLRASVDNCMPGITPDVNSSEEKSLSSNGERGNRPHNRRSSFSSGLEISEAELPSSASKSVPSYMATTESTKARLRGQNSPRVVTTPDTADKSGLMRRHSLPSGTANGKLKPVSPRAQKPVNSGGAKGVIKGGRSLNLSRNGSAEKLVHAEWRRW